MPAIAESDDHLIGTKIFLVNIIGKMPPYISLSVTVALIAGGVVYSLWRTQQEAAQTSRKPAP